MDASLKKYKQNVKNYARKKGLSKSEESKILKETLKLSKFADAIRNNPPVKVIAQPPILTDTIKAQWFGFRDYIRSLNIYYIACHAATCSSYAQCNAPERNSNPVTYPSFVLPPNTFMINIVNGEICTVNQYTERIFLSNEKHYKNAMLIDSPNESMKAYNQSWESPLLSGIHRSGPGTTYPNYKCVFYDKKPMYRLGVFNLSERNVHDDATTVYSSSEYDPRKPLFIEDVIQLVNARKGPGIYILGACSSPYVSNLNSIASSHYATNLVRQNELEYSTNNTTLSMAQIKSIDSSFSLIDSGSISPIGRPPPALMANLAAAHGEHPATLFEDDPYINEVNATLREFKKDPSFKRIYRGNKTISNKETIRKNKNRGYKNRTRKGRK